MKRIFTVLLAVTIIVFCVTGCEKSNKGTTNSTKDKVCKTISLIDVIEQDATNESFYEFNVYYENNCYLINNKTKDCVKEIFNQFDKYSVTETNYYDIKSSELYITFWGKNDSLPISINEKDQIKINYEISYYSKGIYNDIIKYLTPILKENSKYYSVVHNEDFTYSYEIYDYKGNVIESDTTNREPNISICNDSIVWYWVQGGTGTLTRGANFYDTKTGKKSPVFCGITDCYNNLVLNSESKSVIISDMFSGNILQIIDEFKMKPYDAIETIIDARFIENGTKVSITYLAEDSSEQTEIFDVVSSSEKDLPEWKKAYLDFLDDKDGEYLSFALVYIDNDDIPELYMSGCCEATGDSISSFKKGKIVEQLLNRIGGGKYIRKDGKIYNCNGNMGYYQTHVYELDNNGFNQTFNAYLIEHLGDDKITYEYSVEDKLVSKEEYDAAINAVFNIDNSIRLNENAVSYDEIRRQILEY